MGIHHIEDARTSKLLNDHLKSQEVTGEEEAVYQNKLEDALCTLVDAPLLDSCSDLLIDALIDCNAEWYDFIQAIPAKDKAYSMTEALSDAKHRETATQKLIDAMTICLRKSLLSDAEEAAR